MYTIREIAEILNTGEAHIAENAAIKYLLLDSRKVAFPESSLFFAIPGTLHNGHDYIDDLYRKGVRNFVISQKNALHPGANFIIVPDTVEALQKLTGHHRRQFNREVIAITGSNGKTIVKEWLYQLLEPDHKIVRNPKSYNSQVGVPLSVWQMKREHNLAIFEAGISTAGEMEKLEKIIKPSSGIFTNIGQAHEEGFSSREEKIKEKLKLFKNVKEIFFCKDHSEIVELIKQKSLADKTKKFNWSKIEEADLFISNIEQSAHGSHITGSFQGKEAEIFIPFTDNASVENAIHCWLFLLAKGYPADVIQQRMKNLMPVEMRLELKKGINSCSIINDSYNSDLESIAIALDFLQQQKQHKKKTVILSDILQSGSNKEAVYRQVGAILNSKNITRLIGIGANIAENKTTLSLNSSISAQFFPTTEAFLRQVSTDDFNNEAILLKGARSFRFEEVNKLLEQRIHETILEINLSALAHNLQVYHSLLKPDTKIMVVVKAFSYGSGSYEIANMLQFQRESYLAVAYADEGVELRKSGITLPIMVINPEQAGFTEIIKYNLEPEIHNFSLMKAFERAVKNSLHLETDLPYPVHIELETGMHRLGFEENDIEELASFFKKNKSLKAASVFSHLAAAEEPDHDEFTRQQIKMFDKMSSRIISELNYPVLRHLLNSGGIVRFPEAQYDMVRLGIGFYGIDTTGEIQDRLRNTGTLKSTVSQVIEVKPGETIGYSRKGRISRPSKIATVSIGYADGLDRRLSNGKGNLIVKGKPAPIVGNICMDMTMIDVSGIAVKEGDEVIIFGEEQPVQTVAEAMGTIPYEVLTGISQRVKRVYYSE